MIITLTAFQRSAFQLNAFEIAQSVAGSGGWKRFWLLSQMIAAQRRRAQREQEREKEEAENDPVTAVAEIRARLNYRTVAPAVPVIDLAPLAAAVRAREEALAMIEFAKMVDDIELLEAA